MTNKTPDYEAWSDRVAADERPTRPTGKGLSGAAARAYALAALEEAAETTEEHDVVRSAGGRPTLDPAGGASVAWRLRAPRDLDAQFRALAAAEGRSFSDALRDAAEEYVATHGPAR